MRITLAQEEALEEAMWEIGDPEWSEAS